uniref:Candidate secreted effector n=2 Tax=Meloidogyne incognita group TaxID=654580 RepID=A0A914KM40_MELIC
MQLLIVSDGCILENRWPFWTLISFVMFQSIWLFIFLITCCCVAVRQAEEEYPEKKIVKSQIKQKTQSLPSPSRPPSPSPKKLSKSKDSKPKKKCEQKQKKEEPKHDLETAAYLTQTFYPIPLEPVGTQRTPSSQSDQCMPASILVVRPPSDEILSPIIEKGPERVETAKQVQQTPSIPSNKGGSNEDIHVETFPVITISAGQEGDIEAVIRQSLKGGQFEFPEKKIKEGNIRHQKKSV